MIKAQEWTLKKAARGDNGAGSYCIATVPHTGSHSTVDLFNLPHVGPNSSPGRYPCWTHTDNMQWLRTTKASLFTTWRDPLLVAVSFKARGTWSESGALDPWVHSPERFKRLWKNWLELRKIRHMPVFDIRFTKMKRRNNDRGADLYSAYERRDLEYLKEKMPEFTQIVRELDWGNHPVEEWTLV